jgi:hypothetical protein
MRPVIVCVAVPILMLLALTLLTPAGWAQGLTATEMERLASASGPNPTTGPAGDAPLLANGGLLYLTSLDSGDGTFAVYDPATNGWTTLTGYDTVCQMAVGTGGELYALRYSTTQIEVYDSGSDTWSYVMDGPPGATGEKCNLEITREGEFLYTEWQGSAVHYTSGGTWHTFSLPFTTNVMGDYDPATHQYVIGEAWTLYAHLIDLTSWTITDFVLGVPGNGENARFSSVMDNRYYVQADSNIYSFDLSNPTLPAQDHGHPTYYTSSAADRASGIIYVGSLDGSAVSVFDPAAGTLVPVAPSGLSTWHSSLAFAAPWEDSMPFADGFESGDTSSWSTTVP